LSKQPFPELLTIAESNIRQPLIFTKKHFQVSARLLPHYQRRRFDIPAGKNVTIKECT
jgi:hypothetical protein